MTSQQSSLKVALRFGHKPSKLEYEMQAMTQSVHNGVIDAFGIRFGASIMIANQFAIMILGLNALRHFEQRLLQKPNTTVKLALPLLRRATGL